MPTLGASRKKVVHAAPLHEGWTEPPQPPPAPQDGRDDSSRRARRPDHLAPGDRPAALCRATRSRSASPPAIPRPTASCSGRGSRPSRWHGGGMPPEAVEVRWEVAHDEALPRDRRGAASRSPRRTLARTRSTSRSTGSSPAAGTTTASSPAARSARSAARAPRRPPARPTTRLRFAFASCQHYEQGYFAAYRHMAGGRPRPRRLPRRLHLRVVAGGATTCASTTRPSRTRSTTTATATRSTRRDPDLQAAHAALPVARDLGRPRGRQRLRRRPRPEDRDAAERVPRAPRRRLPGLLRAHAAARRMRARTGPTCGSTRASRFGRARAASTCSTTASTARTRPARAAARRQQRRRRAAPSARPTAARMLGAEQERWLPTGSAARRARWNLIAQQTLMAQLDRKPGQAQQFWTDGWDGYPAARAPPARLARRARSSPTRSCSAATCTRSGSPTSRPTSTTRTRRWSPPSSSAPRSPRRACRTTVSAELPAENPHVRFFDSRERGYARVEVTPQHWRTDFRAVSTITRPEAGVRTLVSYVVESGKPGAQPT